MFSKSNADAIPANRKTSASYAESIGEKPCRVALAIAKIDRYNVHSTVRWSLAGDKPIKTDESRTYPGSCEAISHPMVTRAIAVAQAKRGRDPLLKKRIAVQASPARID
jgi:hypothetical protein